MNIAVKPYNHDFVANQNNPFLVSSVVLTEDELQILDFKVNKAVEVEDRDLLHDALVNSGGITDDYFLFHFNEWQAENEKLSPYIKLKELYFAVIRDDLKNGTRFGVFVKSGDLEARARAKEDIVPCKSLDDVKSAVRHRVNTNAVFGLNQIDAIIKRNGIRDATFYDFGCGSGAVLKLASERNFSSVIGVEIDKDVLGVAKRNFEILGIQDRVKLYWANARNFSEYSDKEHEDAVICMLFYNSFGGGVLREMLTQAFNQYSSGILAFNKLLPEHLKAIEDAANDAGKSVLPPMISTKSTDEDNSIDIFTYGGLS